MIFLRFSRRTAQVVAMALALVVALPPSATPVAAQQPATADTGPASPTAVVIPNFWDPRSRVERPPVGAVPAIRFITTDDFPPFNFLDENGRLTGFNVDLARAICAELGIRCTIQAREWAELTDRIADATADAAIAGVAITAENRATLDFSEVYMRTPARFVVRKDEAGVDLSPEGLRGKTLAVVARTAHEAYLAAMFPEVGRRLYPDADAARAAVKNGEADAHFGDGLQLSFWLESEAADDCCAFVGGPYLESRFFGQGYAIAIARSPNTDLKRAINAALQAIYEKGVFAELYLRYFPVGFF
jgi:polar amino acid transport system substrate-binding protein